MKNEPIYILLADDDEDDRLIFSDALNEIKMNTIVNTVNDGQELLNYLNKDGVVLPNVLFLDLNMPRMNGLEFLTELRANPEFEQIPVFITTTSGMEIDRLNAANLGVQGYILKPLDFETGTDLSDSLSLLEKLLK
jgi:CheY-like chemotaxis protein